MTSAEPVRRQKIKVAMIPGKDAVGQPNGISRVIENYLKYGEDYGIDFYDAKTPGWDIRLSHAGMTGSDCDISMLHGIYFTGDYQASKHEYHVNDYIVDSVRSARAITVPSNWVSEIIQRDMHITPFVIPHGIDWQDWNHTYPAKQYVLYNKNRDGFDVCDSSKMDNLANMCPDIQFVSTFSKSNPSNVEVIGVQPHDVMKKIIQESYVYLSVTKETFGVGSLEALASGVPVLGWRYGGNVDTVKHGVCGYLADPDDYDDLERGLRYIFKYRKVLSDNAKIVAREFSWRNSMEKLREVVDYTYNEVSRPKKVSVIIPTYNYAHKLERCVDSVLNQTEKPDEIIIVDDGSTDDTDNIATALWYENDRVKYVKKENGGVATARNLGASIAEGDYLCFLDADDKIDPDFIEITKEALETDSSLYIAYTGLKWIDKDGKTGISSWPGEWDFDAQIKRKNQVPTCNLMRREVIDRTGGYRQRYAPHGAGSEDAELWTKAGLLGMKAAQVTKYPLFVYSVGDGNVSGNKQYQEVDWLGWFGCLQNGNFPFASYVHPNKISHKVFQYDEPLVSVIIPVGPGHENKITEAIDSVEAQTYNKWECIVVSDTNKDIDLSGWPFVRYFKTAKAGSGPGKARNIGAENARGKFVLFLDADDWLDPKAIESMLARWSLENGIVYSDYYGIATVDSPDQFGDRVAAYDERLKRALIRHRSQEYNCEKAQLQPDESLYHWCIVTCLIPLAWHNEIGGFDETMRSWEDVDYHWRMAKTGKCYTHIEDYLVYYRFDTGMRRNKANPDTNLDTAKDLLLYMKNKYKGLKNMPCKGCGGNSVTMGMVAAADIRPANEDKSDNEFVLIVYNHPSRGDHRVVGPATGLDYGYRCGGDKFLVKQEDISLMPDLFIPEEAVVNMAYNAPKVVRQEVKEPTLIAPKIEAFDLEAMPGITRAIAKKLTDAGIDTKEKFFSLDEETLLAIDGIGDARAKTIFITIEKMKNASS